ncbi:MAG: ArsR/SmtB family transcription factor, partial [Chitinophagales bacterium]
PITVTELYNRLNLEQSVASQHLAILRKAGAVKTNRDGKFIFYSINDKRLNDLNGLVNEIIKQ